MEQEEGQEPDAPDPMVAALHFCFSLVNRPRLRRRFQLPASCPTCRPHGLPGVRQTLYQRPLCRPCLAPLLVGVRPHPVQFFSAVLAQYERHSPFPKKPPSAAGVIEPPGLSSGPTSSEPLMSILFRQPEKARRLRSASIERPSTSRAAGRIPAISQVVGIKSVWLTNAVLVAPLLTPGPLTKKGTSELSQ